MNRRRLIARLPALAALPLLPGAAAAASRREIDAEVAIALQTLRGMDHVRPLFQAAHAILVFPRIISGGFILGGQYGEGALIRGHETEGHYRIAGASFGLLAGAQTAGIAMFFMNEAGLRALMAADGWEIGTGPSVVALDQGVQANVSITTLREPVYSITFGQRGLMAALALNGTKITRFRPE